MREAGYKLPTEMAGGRSRCFCGAEIDIAGTEHNGIEAAQDGRIFIEQLNAPFLASGLSGDAERVRHTSAARHCSFCNSLRVSRAGPQASPQTGGENGSSGRLSDRPKPLRRPETPS
jgi:hypothetical protein